jgi:hypothetical protein
MFLKQLHQPSFKNTRSTGIMPSVLYCNAALQQGTGNFKTFLLLARKKI